jgi:capsular polysaccharide export protein
MRLWKRPVLQKVFGRHTPMIFEDQPDKARAAQRPWMVWAGKADVGHADAIRIEDGFIRSKGLGAELIPPLSLVSDDLGIYYDPSGPSRLEHLIAQRAALRPDQEARARRLIRVLKDAQISKYNTGGTAPELPPGHRILVPGQVEDDAAVLKGAGEIKTNQALLETVRKENPEAVLIYKPHPDVEAGLRPGDVDAGALADVVLNNCDPAPLFPEIDAVWTITSLLGFEALLRGVPVVTLGVPFYAGWGLTLDRGAVPPRRRAEPSLEGLVHAALIDYPRYVDPVTGLPCPVEIVVERLAKNQIEAPGPLNRTLSKLQGLLASRAHWWR